MVALLLCLATAMCYAELAKLYPGTGSSYYFAEQSFLNHEKAWQYARLSKFIVGWASHLYYWVYPGVMVGVMGVLCGYLAGTLWPNFMSASNPGPAFMWLVAIASPSSVAYIAYRGVNSSTAVNIAINVIQISALMVFSVMAIGYRWNHPPGSVASSSTLRRAKRTRTSSPRSSKLSMASRSMSSTGMPTEFPSPCWMLPASQCRSPSTIPLRTPRAIS